MARDRMNVCAEVRTQRSVGRMQEGEGGRAGGAGVEGVEGGEAGMSSAKYCHVR